MNHGNGIVEKLPSGRFRARVSINGRKRSLGVFDTREEAESMAGAASVQLYEASRAGSITAAREEPETLRSYGEKWMRARELSGKFRGVQNEWSVWNAHVAPSDLAAMPLEDITKRHVLDWLEEMETKQAVRRWRDGDVVKERKLGRRLSWKTVRHALALLRQCMKRAAEKELIDRNPMLEVEHEVDRAESRDLWTFLTTEEIERVRRCEGIPPEVRSLLTVAIFTGLRKGELWGLHWRDVRLDGPMPEITVRFSHKGPTKSGKVRRVPLLAPALAELQAHRERAGNPPGDALVFPGPDGGHRHASYDAGWAGNTGSRSKPAWPGYRAAAGIRPEVRFHDLRHTCASHLVMGTWGRQWTLQEVAQFLGHSDIKVTQIYAHLSPDHLHRAAQGTPGGMAPTLTPTAVQAPESTQRAVGVMIRSKNFTSAP